MQVLLSVLFLVAVGFSQTLYVASASSMRPLMEEALRIFEENNSIKVRISYGSSGNLFRQILGGAPYDVFISASEIYPAKLIELGKAHKPTLFAYGRLALFTLKEELNSQNGLKRANRIAVANPRHAPYGKAALEFLKRAGLYGELRTKLIYGSNVAQAFQFVVSGGAEVGIVSLSLALAYPEGYSLPLPEDTYSPIKHVAVITEVGGGKEAAVKFLEFLKTHRFKELLKRFGFGVP